MHMLVLWVVNRLVLSCSFLEWFYCDLHLLFEVALSEFFSFFKVFSFYGFLGIGLSCMSYHCSINYNSSSKDDKAANFMLLVTLHVWCTAYPALVGTVTYLLSLYILHLFVVVLFVVNRFMSPPFVFKSLQKESAVQFTKRRLCPMCEQKVDNLSAHLTNVEKVSNDQEKALLLCWSYGRWVIISNL